MDYTNVKVGLRKEDLYEISNPDFLFFWGHHGKPGETTKACLSQWYPLQLCGAIHDGRKGKNYG